MSSRTRSVTVHIAGQRLSLRTDREDAFLQHIADYVGSLVEGLQSAAPQVPPQQVYLLVALQLADELYAERERLQDVYQEIERRSGHILDVVDAELGQMAQEASQQS